MRKSARRLGQMVGLDSKEVNQKLAELGYLEGQPGNWSMTEEGRKHGKSVFSITGTADMQLAAGVIRYGTRMWLGSLATLTHIFGK